MTKPYKYSVSALNANHARQRQAKEAARTSEVARQATILQKQGMTRTEALKAVERLIPH